MTTNRRRLIQGIGVSAGALVLPGCNQPSEETAQAATAAVSPPSSVDPLDLDAVAQAELIRAGQISPLEVLDATIERIERLDPILNAVVAADFEGARDLARQQTEALANGGKPEGVLYGVPYLVKDLAEVAGLPMDRGSRMFQGTIADQDDPTVVPLRAAGMNIFGKTATLMEVRLHTGRTHQIRVHAAHAGHPVEGRLRAGSAPRPGVRPEPPHRCLGRS